MAVTANVHEAKTTLSKLIERALAGEDVVIAKAGKPAVRLMPLPQKEGPGLDSILGKYPNMILDERWEEPEFDEEMLERLYAAPELDDLPHAAEHGAEFKSK